MIVTASKRLARGFWSRRWLRRITYMLIAGATVTGAGLWTVRQSFFNRWLITRLDGLLQHALEYFAGKPVLAVRQVQAAEHELGFGAVVLELTALLRGQ
jgi:type VI protein secretion system component VasK